jgi:hypothetical protein
MVKIADSNGAPCRSGIDKLKELVGKRIDLGKVFGAAPEEAVEQLVKASGGYPRDLIRLAREVLLRAQDFPVDKGLVDRIVDNLAESYALVVRASDLNLLCEVARSHQPPPGDVATMAAFGRLVERWLVLAYRNGREWYDLHPMVARSPLVEERLRAGSAARS